MLRNYFKVAWRNVVKNKVYSFINIFGLAVAMAICMGIIMLVADQMTYDLLLTPFVRSRFFRKCRIVDCV